MGQSSEWAIDIHNERMESDERYAADYEENMRIDAALEAEWHEQERENEKQTDWFAGKLIDQSGESFELEPEPQPIVLMDDDLPF